MCFRQYIEFLPGPYQGPSAEILGAVCAKGGSWLVANLEAQTLELIRGERECLKRYRISSARKGVGNIIDSEQTPIGLHRVCEKIGDGLAPGAVLRGRVATGELATGPAPPDPDAPARITSRILRLEGLNEGLNAGRDSEGRCVDSYQRYIYIHGTDREFAPGQRTSQGCLTLRDPDIIELYGLSEVGSPLLVIEGA